MPRNRIAHKRTSTSGLLPNTTNSANSAYIAAGELAINLTDFKVLSSNGSSPFEVGANLNSLFIGTGNVTANATSLRIGTSATLIANGANGTAGQVLTSNGTTVYWSTVSGGGGGLAESYETVNKNLKAYAASYTYSTGRISTIVYTVPPSSTITKTFNYTGDLLTSIVLSGSTPGGIQLTKTITYSGSDISSVAYS